MDFDTFEQFMAYADKVVSKLVGLSIEDFADAPWHDLYDDLNGELTDEDIFECLAEADDVFARMWALKKEENN